MINVRGATKTLSISVTGEDVDLLLAALTSAREAFGGDGAETERERRAVEMLDIVLEKANA